MRYKSWVHMYSTNYFLFPQTTANSLLDGDGRHTREPTRAGYFMYL